MNIRRIYTQMDDFGGWHTALYYDKDSANQYFKNVRKKHPDAYVITEVLDDETGEVIERREFSKDNNVTVDEVKAMRQEYVSLFKYDVAWKEETLVEENIPPQRASEYMISAAGTDGYGIEWVYIIKPCCFVEHVNFIDNVMDEQGHYLSLKHMY